MRRFSRLIDCSISILLLLYKLKNRDSKPFSLKGITDVYVYTLLFPCKYFCQLTLMAFLCHILELEINKMQKNGESSFSIELKSKEYLKTMNLANGAHEGVVVEGTIGQLLYAQFTEGIMLEVVCKKGTLRMDLSPDQIKNQREVKKTNECNNKNRLCHSLPLRLLNRFSAASASHRHQSSKQATYNSTWASPPSPS